MVIRHSNASAKRPIPSGELPERRFQGIKTATMKVLEGSEQFLLAAGLACVVFYIFVRIYSTATSHASLWSFSQLRVDSAAAKYEESRDPANFRQWADKRVAAYKRALALRLEPPLAVLSIPRLRLDVPVFEGTDALTLDRGAGRIAGTARLGEFGNIGIAAHRDGFFRSLKSIRPGDRLELDGLRQRFIYTVDNITIVDPNNTTVLQSRTRPSLTMVTCYPFYFVGDAPQRFVVQASLATTEQTISKTDVATTTLNKEKTP